MPTKVGFVLPSNSKQPIASTRISVLNMFPFLRMAGLEPHIAFEPVFPSETPDVRGLAERLLAEEFKIVYFQKVHGPDVERLAKQLNAARIRTVYGVCDLINVSMAQATDATIVVTNFLKSLYPSELQSKIHVVHDGIERLDLRKKNYSAHRGSSSRPLRAVLVTSSTLDHLPVISSPPKWLEIVIVGRYAPPSGAVQRLANLHQRMAGQSHLHMRIQYLKFLANRRIRCKAWDPIGVYEEMQNADIGIIPIETPPEPDQNPPPSWKVKSENRLTMKLSMGLPVIATPIPAYESIIKQGVNGFLARTRCDWDDFLEALRDPAFRYRLGQSARESVLDRYSMDEQACRLLDVLNDLLRSDAALEGKVRRSELANLGRTNGRGGA